MLLRGIMDYASAVNAYRSGAADASRGWARRLHPSLIGKDIYKGASHAASQYAPPQRREEPI
jgi:hypothetical protein